MRSLAIRMAHAAIGLLAIAGTSSALDVGRSAENSVVVKRAADADAAAIADPDAHASADAIPDALANADADAIADASADPNAVAKAAFDLPLTSVASPPASRLAKRGASASLQPRFDVRCYNYLDYDAVSPKVVVPWKMSQRWIFAFERGEFRSIDRTLATSTKALAGGAHACVPVVNDEPGTPYGGSWAPRADPVETAVSEILNKTIHKPLPKGAASTPTPGPGTPSATPSAAALVQKASTAGAGGKGAAATPTPKPTPTAASVQFHQNASHAHTRPEQSDRPRLKPRAAAAAAAATTALPKSTVLYDEYRVSCSFSPELSACEQPPARYAGAKLQRCQSAGLVKDLPSPRRSCGDRCHSGSRSERRVPIERLEQFCHLRRSYGSTFGLSDSGVELVEGLRY